MVYFTAEKYNSYMGFKNVSSSEDRRKLIIFLSLVHGDPWSIPAAL
jgi:hypothetical protein